VDSSLLVLAGATAICAGVALTRDPKLLAEGLWGGARLLRSVWIELALGFFLAGLIGALIPPRALATALGADSGWRGIGVGWVIGLLLPGGPYVLFPIVAVLLEQGASVSAVITLVSAKTLVSPLRMITYEAPLNGWPFTLARLIPGALAAPLLGLAGGWCYRLLSTPRR
jgi:uncharacterized membrane protein YraQ (UPF0718 family)